MTPSLLLRELLDWRVYPDVLVLAVMAFLRYRTLRAMGTWKIALGQGMEVGGGGGGRSRSSKKPPRNWTTFG